MIGLKKIEENIPVLVVLNVGAIVWSLVKSNSMALQQLLAMICRPQRMKPRKQQRDKYRARENIRLASAQVQKATELLNNFCQGIFMKAIDCNGSVVRIGSIVKVLDIDTGFLRSLPEDERRLVESLRFCELEVKEINDGYVVVGKEWDMGEDRTQYHSISLSSKEILLVR